MSLSPQADPLPDKVDLSDKMPPVGDQGGLGSATSFAVGANMMTALNEDSDYVYYEERALDSKKHYWYLSDDACPWCDCPMFYALGMVEDSVSTLHRVCSDCHWHESVHKSAGWQRRYGFLVGMGVYTPVETGTKEWIGGRLMERQRQEDSLWASSMNALPKT